jgi:hypothetical protein
MLAFMTDEKGMHKKIPLKYFMGCSAIPIRAELEEYSSYGTYDYN